MKVLVTGCAGFIGSHLCTRLLDQGYEVTGIDCLTDYYEPHVKLRNLDSIPRKRAFKFLQCDLITVDLAPLADESAVIFHLAAQPGVRASWGKNFDTYLRNNVMATQRLLECAAACQGLKKFVFASSSSVYGEICQASVNEEHPTRPFSPYGVTKLAAEHLCSLYGQNYGLPVVSLRFFTVYGPGQRPDMAFARLIRAALTGASFTLYGDGTQERDFTYVDDVIEGLVRAAENGHARGVFNIGGGQVVSLNEVISLVQELTGRSVRIERTGEEKGDVRRTSADISKIASALGYRPRRDLQFGLALQIRHMEKLLPGLRKAGGGG